MARQLLQEALRTGTMMMACLLSAVMSSGCVVPLPLQEEGYSNENHPPVIIGGEPVDFLHPQWTPASSSDAWAFGVTVSDPDPATSQDLEARLYLENGQQLLPYSSIPLAAPQSDPTTYQGSTIPAKYCSVIQAEPGRHYLFFVFVSDAGFPQDGDPTGLEQGHYDYKYWDVTCP